MSYQALYRRLRPQRFEDVIGQEHIIKTLRNQIQNDRINHAYLFCGTRGTGKTTTAKIFARAVNCTSDGSKPCNECEICRDILDGKSTNIIELDAASNSSVENIREIVDEVRYVPTVGRYRVYIIDEVHMLSNSAFNALLKTLEEPPSHAVFILATTDPQKIPVTVLSRCQRFDFHRINHSAMVEVLREYMVSEGKSVSEEALNYIAEISDGAMRDALSVLDQCISFYYDSEITVEQVREVTGSVDRAVFFELTDAVNENKTARCMQLIEDMLVKGRDIHHFTSDLVLHFRNLLLAGSVNKQTLALDYSEDYVDKLRSQSVRVGFEYLLWLVKEFSELANQMKYSSVPRILLEVCCIKACNPVTSANMGAVSKRLNELEKRLESGVPVRREDVSVPQEVVREESESNSESAGDSEKTEISKAIPEDIQAVIKAWASYVKTLKQNTILREVLLGFVTPCYLEDDSLTLVCPNNGYLLQLDKHLDSISDTLSKYFNKEFNIKLMTTEAYNARHKSLYGAEDKSVKELSREDFTAILGDVYFDD